MAASCPRVRAPAPIMTGDRAVGGGAIHGHVVDSRYVDNRYLDNTNGYSTEQNVTGGKTDIRLTHFNT